MISPAAVGKRGNIAKIQVEIIQDIFKSEVAGISKVPQSPMSAMATENRPRWKNPATYLMSGCCSVIDESVPEALEELQCRVTRQSYCSFGSHRGALDGVKPSSYAVR